MDIFFIIIQGNKECTFVIRTGSRVVQTIQVCCLLKRGYSVSYTHLDVYKRQKLYSKDADILTTHPAGSYAMEKDDKGQLTLKITNPKDFWSVSKYLVIQVK